MENKQPGLTDTEYKLAQLEARSLQRFKEVLDLIAVIGNQQNDLDAKMIKALGSLTDRLIAIEELTLAT